MLGVWSIVFSVIGVASLLGVVIGLVLLEHRQAAIQEQLRLLGGRFGYELTYSGGYTIVLLRFFEGNTRDSQLSKGLGIAQGLVPQRREDGYYLARVDVKHLPKARTWEMCFLHETPAKLPMAPELLLRFRIENIMRLVGRRTKANKGTSHDDTVKILKDLRQIRDDRLDVDVEEFVRTKHSQGGV